MARGRSLPAWSAAGLALALTLPALARGAPTSVFLVAAAPGAIPTDAPVNARLGEEVRIFAVVRSGRGARAAYYSDAPSLRVGRTLLRRPRLQPLAALGPVRWRWLLVEPRPHHVTLDPPNAGNPAYSNAVLFGPDHGKWLGYDTLEYAETPVEGATSGTLSLARVQPSHPKVNVHGGLGTMRFKVVLERGGQVFSSPGPETASRAGISPLVLRVTFRAGDDLVGYLRGYFNVPNVFGSAGLGRTHQTELYQGADCADVIIGAMREAGARVPYTSVLGFKRYARPVTERLLMKADGFYDPARDGARVHLRFDEDVKAGDILLIDYADFDGSPRSWDHIAVIDRASARNGELDPQAPVLHMGYLYGLTEEPAATQAPAFVQLLRLRPALLRAMERQRQATARPATPRARSADR